MMSDITNDPRFELLNPTEQLLAKRLLSADETITALRAKHQEMVEVVHWAQAILTAWNVGDMPRECPLHKKLREVMITYRSKEDEVHAR